MNSVPQTEATITIEFSRVEAQALVEAALFCTGSHIGPRTPAAIFDAVQREVWGARYRELCFAACSAAEKIATVALYVFEAPEQVTNAGRLEKIAARVAGRAVCRECGCTEDHACVTVDGPCHWAEHDLCSACAAPRRAAAADTEPLSPTMVVYLLEPVDPTSDAPAAQTRLQWRARRGAELPHEARVARLETVCDLAARAELEKELPTLGLLMRSHLLMGALFLFEYRAGHFLDLTSAVRARLSSPPPAVAIEG